MNKYYIIKIPKLTVDKIIKLCCKILFSLIIIPIGLVSGALAVPFIFIAHIIREIRYFIVQFGDTLNDARDRCWEVIIWAWRQ